MSNSRTRAATSRTSVNAVSSRKRTGAARPAASAETLADAALELRKAFGGAVDALTDLAAQRIQLARDEVTRRADEARQAIDRSVKSVEARVRRVVKVDSLQSVRDAAQTAVKRVTRQAEQEVNAARKAANRVTRDASAQVRAGQKAVRREVSAVRQAVQKPVTAAQAPAKAAAKKVSKTVRSAVSA
jgi:hypothetical protein